MSVERFRRPQTDLATMKPGEGLFITTTISAGKEWRSSQIQETSKSETNRHSIHRINIGSRRLEKRHERRLVSKDGNCQLSGRATRAFYTSTNPAAFLRTTALTRARCNSVVRIRLMLEPAMSSSALIWKEIGLYPLSPSPCSNIEVCRLEMWQS